jgi:hypothetical protein
MCLNAEYDRLSNELATIEARISELSSCSYEVDGFADRVVELGELVYRKDVVNRALFVCFEQMIAPVYAKRKNKPRARGWWQHQLMLIR